MKVPVNFALACCSLAGLIWLLAARLGGPSDLWDQTQPKTVSYTTDMLVHGGSRWILPIERGELPATKPPLYNWVAAPAVKLMGFKSEIAHKFPSLIALCGCWLIVVRLGSRLDDRPNQCLGWLAGLIFVANYTIFKLGYLARPDMVLTLWLGGAWVTSTAIFVGHVQGGRAKPPSGDQPVTRGRQILMVAGFWICIALSGLTKGPVAIAGVAYAVIAARVIGGSWREIRRLWPAWGLVFSGTVVGLWIYAVWHIDAEHLRQVIWHDEIFGRFTGTGPEGSKEGLRGWFQSMPEMGFYYLIRFAPWSLCSIAAMIVLWRRKKSNGLIHPPIWKMLGVRGAWLCAAAMYVMLIVALFTISASKRADYIAAAFAPGAILAAWWLQRVIGRDTGLSRWLAPATAMIVLTALTIVNQAQPAAPCPGFGDHIRDFINRASAPMAREPLTAAFYSTGDTHLQAMLGASTKDSSAAVRSLLKQGRPFWVVAGRRYRPPHDFTEWLLWHAPTAQVETLVRSQMLPRTDSWPEQVALYRVVP